MVFFDWCSNIFWAKPPIRKPVPPLRALLATPQKNTLCSFHFARARFFLLLMKRVFFCGVLPSKYSGRWRDWPQFDFAKKKRNSPHTQYERIYWVFVFNWLSDFSQKTVECRDGIRHYTPWPCRSPMRRERLMRDCPVFLLCMTWANSGWSATLW